MGLHLKGLNGVRAIAALAVVVSHTLIMGEGIFGLPHNSRGVDLGGFGVSIFFCLSGFLITYLLLLEKEKSQTINIKAFYVRRMLRIWPLYYFYLLLSLIVTLALNVEPVRGSFLYYVFLCANIPFILNTQMALAGHYWSLGVEEQFYLFWPWVIKKVKNLGVFLFVFIVVMLAVKIGLRYYDTRTGISWPYQLIHVTRFECMAIGALAAVLCYRKKSWFFRLVLHPVVEIMAWISIILMLVNKFHLASVIDNDIVAAITVIIIMNVAFNEKRLIGLENRVSNFLGKISYGIYVYHPLVLFLVGRFLGGYFTGLSLTTRYLLAFLFILAFTILAAWASYELLEKKFLRLKEKFAVVPSSA